MSSLQKNLLKSKLPPMIPRPAKNHPGRQKDYTPSIWNGKYNDNKLYKNFLKRHLYLVLDYFHDYVDVAIDCGSFRVYRSQVID